MVRGGSAGLNHLELMRNSPLILVPSGAEWFESCGHDRYLPVAGVVRITLGLIALITFCMVHYLIVLLTPNKGIQIQL